MGSGSGMNFLLWSDDAFVSFYLTSRGLHASLFPIFVQSRAQKFRAK
jgi:hypothetical protein